MTHMPPKSYHDLVVEAQEAIAFVSVADALDWQKTSKATFIDLRVLRELQKTGVIPEAHSCPRGLLEFWLDQSSPYAREIFGTGGSFVFYCDNGWRAALATRLAGEMGLQQAFCLDGGLDAWMSVGGPVVPYKW